MDMLDEILGDPCKSAALSAELGLPKPLLLDCGIDSFLDPSKPVARLLSGVLQRDRTIFAERSARRV
jgi:hypothetical protein